MSVVFISNYFFSVRRHLRRQQDAFDDRLHESQDQAGLIFRMYL
jgi:hypothetical protein